jgi:hypothetical protein
MCGLVTMCRNVARIVVAVVLAPAKLYVELASVHLMVCSEGYIHLKNNFRLSFSLRETVTKK